MSSAPATTPAADSATAVDADVLCRRGLSTYHGTGTKIDVIEAVRLLQRAAEAGSVEAWGHLAGIGASYALDPSTVQISVPDACLADAVAIWKQNAETGDSDAQFYLARCFSNGLGVPQDKVEAVRLLRLSADQGHALSQWRLGRCYNLGHGVKKDPDEAFRLFKESAAQGCVDAYCDLGAGYANGTETRVGEAEASRFLRLAVKQNCPSAQGLMGWMGVFRLGAPHPDAPSEEEALHLLRLSAAQGCLFGLLTLAAVEADNPESVQLLQRAAKLGDSVAQFMLGDRYADGQGVEADATEAARYYKLSSDQGHETALWEMATCYLEGRGIQRDVEKAIVCLKRRERVIDEFSARAQFCLRIATQERALLGKVCAVYI